MAYYHSHQILPMTYGLNKSFNKLLHVGLEKLSKVSSDFKPTICVSDREFRGIKFSVDGWREFTKCFSDIEKYFLSENDEMLDQQIKLPGCTVRFIISYSDKAFELTPDSVNKEEEEDLAPPKKRQRTVNEDGDDEKKKKKPYHFSLVFKRNTFECLKALVKCVDTRIEYLCKIEKCMNFILGEMSRQIKDNLQDNINSQYTVYYNRDVIYAMSFVHDCVVEFIDKYVSENNLGVTHEDVDMIVRELVALHVYDVTHVLNKNAFNKLVK